MSETRDQKIKRIAAILVERMVSTALSSALCRESALLIQGLPPMPPLPTVGIAYGDVPTMGAIASAAERLWGGPLTDADAVALSAEGEKYYAGIVAHWQTARN